MTTLKDPDGQSSFAETAMTLAGKSVEEAKRTGAVDRADDQVEDLFAPQYKTVNSPIHKAVWENRVPIDLFTASKVDPNSLDLPVVHQTLEILKKARADGTIYDEKGKISDKVFEDLGKVGYWGLFIPKKYGGQGLTVHQFMTFLAKVATIEPMVAGLASVHGCIGAVDPIKSFGNEEQKNKFLPKLANGEMISAFALTEPCAGSDLTNLRTTAVLEGDHYVVNGEKLFITNAVPGRTIGLVCLVDGKPSVLIVELPKKQDDSFQIVPYGIHAVRRAWNQGLKFKNFKVPKENLLVPNRGDGLTIAYHGLNLGRIALCAASSTGMKAMLASMMPWVHFRETYGCTIDKRELIKRRVARTAGLIAGAEALVSWASSLLDQGYRGELECILTKIFGSESQKEVAIEYCMKTHGGRSFLHGHLFGDNVHEFLAPCIYEGEGEILGMAFFKSLAKEHGVKYFEPIGKALAKHKIKTLEPWNPMHLWLLRNELSTYPFWYLGKLFAGADKQTIPGLSPVLQDHVDFALSMLEDAPRELSSNMVKHQLKLADRQCLIAEMSQRIQDTIVMLVTVLWANQQDNEVIKASADILCQDIRRKLTGERPTNDYYRACSKLADMIYEQGYPGMNDIDVGGVLFPYDRNKPKAAKEQEPTPALAK
jgi:alkylation response protein AidB-like acyl-CoA dehydrogenase